jgi:hypothetical protein
VSATEQHVVSPRPPMLRLLPRFDEPISPEFYRHTGKIRAIAMALLLALDLSVFAHPDAVGYDVDFYLRFHYVHGPLLLADIALGLWLWRGRMPLATMRRITLVCVVIESLATLLFIWAQGSVTSHMIVVGMLMVLLYRVGLDFAAGATVFCLLLVGHWLIVAAEIGGVLSPQPLMVEQLPGMYRDHPTRQLGAMVVVTVLMITTFLAANWTVARLRHKDRAIRILRETLAASGAGEVGRHTGRTLRDTYAVETRLGTGGMGEVYRGQHLRTRRPVALKILHPHLVEDPALLARFRREAEITGRLGSEHIVEILDIDEDDGVPFLVLELLEGEDLADRVAREGPQPLAVVADWVGQIAEGLEVAHRAGVVHRDLKPENIYVCPRPDGDVLKVLDFGISKIRADVTAITQELALIGTPDFMSPEQATGLAWEVDARTDVFALGGLAYFALTGARPFQATSIPALLRRICDEEPVPVAELRPELPAAVTDALTVALAKRAGQRLGSVSELAAALRRAADGVPDAELAARARAVTRGRPASRSVVTPVAPAAAVADTLDVSGAAAVDADLLADLSPRRDIRDGD